MIDEFRQCSAGKSFHILQFSDFLDLQEVSDSTIEDVKIEEEHRSLQPKIVDTPFQKYYRNRIVHSRLQFKTVQNSVQKWLISRLPSSSFNASNIGLFDFIIKTEDEAKNINEVGVIVLYLMSVFDVQSTFRDLVLERAEHFQIGETQKFVVFIVVEDMDDIAEVFFEISRLKFPDHYNFSVIFGSRSLNNTFVSMGTKSVGDNVLPII
ncbi:MAG: hypothetical protein ACTSO3_06145 [Candidatus Heimdallarchaeaceae archaeon]